jgi:hypothetical protein
MISLKSRLAPLIATAGLERVMREAELDQQDNGA